MPTEKELRFLVFYFWKIPTEVTGEPQRWSNVALSTGMEMKVEKA
jgi:hypothetical protein